MNQSQQKAMKVIEIENSKKEIAMPRISNLLNINDADNQLTDIIPQAKIEYLTGNAPKDFKKGWFSFNMGYQKKEVRVVLLAMRFSKIMWPPYEHKKEQTLSICKSDDGRVAASGMAFKKGTLCSKCDHATWNNSSPPKCADVYTLLLWDLEDNLPFILPVKRTSIYPLRKLKTVLKFSANRWAHPGSAPNACVSLLLKTKPVDNYYVIDFPQREDDGTWIWGRLEKSLSHDLTNVAQDLTHTFSELDIHHDEMP